MKKYLKLLTLAFIPLVIGSCKDDSGVTNDNNNNNTTDNGNNNQITEDTPKDIKVGEFYESTSWDKTVDKMLETVVGKDLVDKIPKFICPDYVSKVEYSQDGNDIFLVFNIYCYGPNMDSASKIYGEKLEENGFTLASTKDYGYYMKDYESDLFVGYGISDTLESFDIRAVVRQSRQLEWDSEFIDLYAGTEVPVCDAEAYTITYDNYRDQVYVYAMFVGDSAMKNYEQRLKMNQYTYSSESTSESSLYYDPTGYVSVQIYETYGDYNCKALYITITNAWPTIGIVSFTGLLDFPKLESTQATYDTYQYRNIAQEGEDENWTLCLYYNNASNIDFANYVNKMVNDFGFTASDATSDENYNSVYLNLTVDTYTVTIRVLLSFQQSSICIVFYQSDIPTQTTGE